MPGLSEEDIRTRAYELWRAAREPSGRMDTFWYKAEKELLAERSAQGEVALGNDGQNDAPAPPMPK